MNTSFDDMEEGVCVACKAKAETTHRLSGSRSDAIPVCLECKDDGSYLKWLTEALERAAMDAGWPFTIKDGKKLFTAPPKGGGK